MSKKAIVISIKPKWVAKILNGEKTIEIRKTCPSIFKHLKSYEGASLDVYIYCTKEKPNLWLPYEYGCFELDEASQPYLSDKPIIDIDYKMNNKVVAKFTLNKVETIWKTKTEENPKHLLKNSCLSFEELSNYLNGYVGYAWHISNLEMLDEPKELSEFRKYYRSKGFPQNRSWNLTKAPQSWQFIEVE